MKKVDETVVYSEEITLSQMDSEKKKENSYKINKKLIIFGFIFLSLTVIFSSMNEHITQPFLQVYMYDTLELGTISVMIILYTSRIIGLIAAPQLGKYADRVGVVGFIIVSGCGGIITAILISTNTPWLFILLLFMDLILALSGQLISQNLFSRISVTHRGRVFGLMEWMNLIGWVVGPLLGGWLWDIITPKAPFVFSIILELLTIPLFLLALRFLKHQMIEKLVKNS